MNKFFYTIFMLPIKAIILIFWFVIIILIFLNFNIKYLVMADEENFINPKLEDRLDKLFNFAEPYAVAFCFICWFYIVKCVVLNF